MFDKQHMAGGDKLQSSTVDDQPSEPNQSPTIAEASEKVQHVTANDDSDDMKQTGESSRQLAATQKMPETSISVDLETTETGGSHSPAKRARKSWCAAHTIC